MVLINEISVKKCVIERFFSCSKFDIFMFKNWVEMCRGSSELYPKSSILFFFKIYDQFNLLLNYTGGLMITAHSQEKRKCHFRNLDFICKLFVQKLYLIA